MIGPLVRTRIYYERCHPDRVWVSPPLPLHLSSIRSLRFQCQSGGAGTGKTLGPNEASASFVPNWQDDDDAMPPPMCNAIVHERRCRAPGWPATACSAGISYYALSWNMFHDISPHMWKEYIETLTCRYHRTQSPSRVCTTNLLPIRLCPSSTSFLSPHRTRHVVYPLAGWLAYPRPCPVVVHAPKVKRSRSPVRCSRGRNEQWRREGRGVRGCCHLHLRRRLPQSG